VQKVHHLGNRRWQLFTSRPEELRKQVMKWALDNDINISSMQAETQSLEDVFRTLTQKEK
jgi:ABC-2 type transport system ATP-binding protein